MAMLHPTPQSLRPTVYQPPTTVNVVTLRPSQTRPARPKRPRVSEAEYWEKYYDYVGPNDHQYEWNNGYLEEKTMPDHVSYSMYKWLVNLLDHFLEVQPLAKIIGLEMAFRFALPHKVAIRKPDLGVVLNNNPVPLAPRDQSYRGIFDICLESLSYSKPKEVKRDTVTKKREYAQAGVKEYYILDSRGTRTRFYQLTSGGIYRPIPPTSDGLISSNVLPGFQFRRTDLHKQPTLTEMSDDPVYRAFALPALQVARQAQQLAEAQAQAAREAQQVAEASAQEAQEARFQEALARQLAEAQAQAERDVAQTAREAQQLAERQAQTEREARQLVESKLRQLEAELLRRPPM